MLVFEQITMGWKFEEGLVGTVVDGRGGCGGLVRRSRCNVRREEAELGLDDGMGLLGWLDGIGRLGFDDGVVLLGLDEANKMGKV